MTLRTGVKLAGVVLVEAVVKGTYVTRGPNGWNGPKVMLPCCIPWVKGDAEYVRDCISVFEEYGWDWTYHAYREWPGWDVDYDAVRDYDKKLYKPTQPSPRKKALLEGLGVEGEEVGAA